MGRHWATEIYRIRDWAAVGGGCAPIFATSDWREGDVRREFFFFPSMHRMPPWVGVRVCRSSLAGGSGVCLEPTVEGRRAVRVGWQGRQDASLV